MTNIEILQKYDEAVSSFAAGLAAGLLDPDQEKSLKEQYELFKAGRDALRRTAEDDKAREEGRLVELPCKPNETFLHRNYDTGALELNIALHDFDGSTRELPWEEIDQCAYWE